MADDGLLALIAGTPWIAQSLALFDFDITRRDNGPIESVRLADATPLEMIAGDASGGAFLFVGVGGEERPVVYAGSEGEGGLIAVGLREALAMVVWLPSLHDALRFTLDDGTRLRDYLAEADQEILADRPDLPAERARVAEALGLPPATGLLERLHATSADPGYVLMSELGDRYQPMSPTGLRPPSNT
jgi:hypothetical protein